MHYFDSGNRLAQDACALVARDAENTSVSDYVLTNFHTPVCTSQRGDIQNFMEAHPNLHSIDGYSAQACQIDSDSQLRFSQLSRGRSRIQLQQRFFRAVPDLARGVSVPCVESQLQQGESTHLTHKACDKYSERSFARFTQLLNPCWHIPQRQMPFPQSSTALTRAAETKCVR
jgi:hypothetical protein